MASARYICFKFPVKKEQVQILLSIFNKSNLEFVNPVNLRILRTLRLINDRDEITELGIAKLVQMSPLSQQAKILGLDLIDVHCQKNAEKSSEEYVLLKYEALGYQCWHDEGGMISHIINFSLLNEVPLLKSYLENDIVARDNKHFELALNLAFFMDILIDDTLDFSVDRKECILEILRKTTKERIISGYEIWRKAKIEFDGAFNENSFDINSVLHFFTLIGLDRFMSFAVFRLDNYKAAWGWPDIIAVKGSEIKLIEVKKKDKLSFDQAMSHLRLNQLLKNGTISSLHIEKLSLDD